MSSESIEPDASASAAGAVPDRPAIVDPQSGTSPSDGIPPSDPVIHDPVFTVVRRGFDQSEVRRRIMSLSGDLRAARERELLLTRQLDEATRRAEAVDPLDPAHLTKLLGDEVARILDAARAAAAQIRLRADEAATRLFEETKSEAAADAAAVLERAEVEAREILRLAQERSAEQSGDSSGDVAARIDPVPSAKSEPPAQRRRSGVDPQRTAGLFAALRDEQASKVPGSRGRVRAVTRPSSKGAKGSTDTVTATGTVTEPDQAPGRVPQPEALGPRSAVGDDLVRTGAVAGGVAALEAQVSRAIKVALTDDLNELLARVTDRRGRSTPPLRSLESSLGPQVDRHTELIGAVLLDSEFLRAGTSSPEALAHRIAHDIAGEIVIPLRARIDLILAGAGEVEDPIVESLRRCFRDCRSAQVAPAVAAALAPLGS